MPRNCQYASRYLLKKKTKSNVEQALRNIAFTSCHLLVFSNLQLLRKFKRISYMSDPKFKVQLNNK